MHKKERHLTAASFSYMITNQSIVFPDGTSNFGRVLFFHSLPRISVFFVKRLIYEDFCCMIDTKEQKE